MLTSPACRGRRLPLADLSSLGSTLIEDVIAEGDKVVVRATNTCVQESFFGVPGGGRQQTFTAIFIFRLVDGKVAETWRNADDLGRLLQLGARIGPGSPEQ